VRSLFEPFEGSNIAAIDWGVDVIREALGHAYSPDVELRTLASGLGSGVGEFYRGAEGLVRYLREWLEPFSEYHVENLDYIDAGDCVLIPSRQWGVGGGSGARVELELTTLYQLRDGKIARVHQYGTLGEAREAARLRSNRWRAGTRRSCVRCSRLCNDRASRPQPTPSAMCSTATAKRCRCAIYATKSEAPDPAGPR
jgi:ketosteroid isomerase-like protein